MNTPLPNNMAQAREEAIRLARWRLQQTVSLSEAASRVGLPLSPDGSVDIAVLGKPHRVLPESFAVETLDGSRIHGVDEMLILRYLESSRQVRVLNSEITFRDLPGGAFYFGPISNRTTNLLIKTFANDLDRLKQALTRYPHDTLPLGDLAARIQAIGIIPVTLVYHLGDEEFPPAADLIYDRIIASVYTTDEVSALATRLCIGLIVPMQPRK